MNDKVKKLDSVRLIRAVVHAADFPEDYVHACKTELHSRGVPAAFLADLMETNHESTHWVQAQSYFHSLQKTQSLKRLGMFSLLFVPVGVAVFLSVSTVASLFVGLSLALATVVLKSLARSQHRKVVAELSAHYSHG